MVEFFDQNPISQLGMLVTKNGRAEKLTELNGMCMCMCNEDKHPIAEVSGD